MSDFVSDFREIKELLVEVEPVLYGRVIAAGAHIRKAINICDEWLEDE